MTTTAAAVLLTPHAGGAPVDLHCQTAEISITHGRDDPSSQPEASTATLTLDLAGEEPPAALATGARIAVVVDLDTFPGISRFAGSITDVTFTWEPTGTHTPDQLVATIIAAGALASLGRAIIGATPWPTQRHTQRASEIFFAAGAEGFTPTPTTEDPFVTAVDVDARPALELLHELADSTGSLLWQDVYGQTHYSRPSRRSAATGYSLFLGPCDIEASPAWRQTTNGLVNQVSLGYGVAPEGGEQPRIRMTNPASIAAHGTYGTSPSTTLAAEADATALAGLILARSAAAPWALDQISIDLQDTGFAFDLLTGVDFGSLIGLLDLPPAGPAPTRAAVWVEGWNETISAGPAGIAHQITLNVSPYEATAVRTTWADIAWVGWTWATAPPITWAQAAFIPAPLP